MFYFKLQIYRSMRALHIHKYGRFPKLTQLPIPKISKPNQVLVRMKYAPINPSDLHFYMGRYGIRKQGFPIVGFQGSGVIEDAENPLLKGKKVSVTSGPNNGTHATHIVSDVEKLVIWDQKSDLQKISMSWINPFSCLGLYQIIDQQQVQNVVLTGAGSQLNRQMVSYIKKKNPKINVYGTTRRPNFNEELIKSGFKEIFSSQDDFSQNFKALNSKTVMLDCIGGQFAGKLFNSLPQRSVLVSYGRMSGQNIAGIDAGSLYYKNKSIRGFWLVHWFNQSPVSKLLQAKNEVKNNLGIFQQNVRKVFPLSEWESAYKQSIKNQSEGKILLNLQ